MCKLFQALHILSDAVIDHVKVVEEILASYRRRISSSKRSSTDLHGPLLMTWRGE